MLIKSLSVKPLFVTTHDVPTNTTRIRIKLERVLKELQAIVKRDGKRHLMDQQLSHSMQELLQYEVIPLLEAEINYDPTPQY